MSVHEPFLLAFRPPGLVTELIAADVPLVAALRQSELEPFGFPWRLVYLGDPLYRVGRGSRENALSVHRAKRRNEGRQDRWRPTWNWWAERGPPHRTRPRTRSRPHRRDRVGEGRGASRACAGRADRRDGRKGGSRRRGAGEWYDAEKLQLCVDAAIAEAATAAIGEQQAPAGR